MTILRFFVSMVLFVPAVAFAEISPEDLTSVCRPCHGAIGISETPDVPHLDGQVYAYLMESIELLQNGHRHSSVRDHIPADWTDSEIAAAANFYNQSVGEREAQTIDGELFERGEQLFLERCESCHEGGGNFTDYRGTGSPRLATQRLIYLREQILAYASGQRKAMVEMKRVAFSGAPLTVNEVQIGPSRGAITPDDAEALAHFLAGNDRSAPSAEPKSRRSR